MSKLVNGRIVRIVVLGVWLLVLMMLVQRVRSERYFSAADAPLLGLGSSDAWMAVYQGGRRIGFTHQAMATEAGGVTLFEESFLRLKVLDAERSVRTVIHATLDTAYALRRADFTLQSDGSSFTARAEVKGEELEVELDFGTSQSSQSLRLAAPIFLPQSLRSSLRAVLMDEGKELRATVWDPLTSQPQDLTIRVLGRELVPETEPSENGWRVEEESRGVKTTVWLNDEGEVLREQGPLALVLVRATRETALADVPIAAAAMDVARQAAVPVGRIAAPRTRARLQLRLQGIPLHDVPTDAEQTLRGEVLSIERVALGERDTYALPNRAGHEQELSATVFLQSDHPRVRALALEILDGEIDAQRAARRLNDWVYEYVEKVPTISVPNALQVIDSARGDCNEHAVLLAALARSIGLPARVVAGLVYVDDAFLYHAWCEVWLGRWVSVDPSLRQLPADATHLKLIAGGPEKHAALLSVVGKLAIEVVERSE